MPKEKTPLVSVIIPSFNQGNFIAETIESVLNQDYKFLEIIVVDGGSTDNTLSILRAFGNKIKWISEADDGHYDGVNKGFELASGEFVGWLNSDDVYFFSNTISVIVEVFIQRKDIDVIYGDSALISANSTLLRLWFVPLHNKERLFLRNEISQPTVFFRKEITKEVKLEKWIALDYAYWLKLLCLDKKFLKIDYILAGDRVHGERISTIHKKRISEEMEEIRQAYRATITDSKPKKVLYVRARMLGLWFILNNFASIRKRTRIQKSLSFPIKIDSIYLLVLRQLSQKKGSNSWLAFSK